MDPTGSATPIRRFRTITVSNCSMYAMQVVLDRSGIYCATSCTDKTLAIYDYHTGELMATMAGIADISYSVWHCPLKGQSNEIFDCQFFSSFKPACATDQLV